MASPKELTLPVILAPAVVEEIHDIWEWNAGHYGRDRADAYLEFLKARIYGLNRRYGHGKAISTRPDLQYILIRRRSKGHGHVAVYQVDDRAVSVLHVFHTAQDWQSTLADEPSGRE